MGFRKKLEHIKKRADKKAKERHQKMKQRRANRPISARRTKTEIKSDRRVDGGPTTEAIELWGPAEFCEAFNEEARKHKRFREGPFTRDLAAMRQFIDQIRSFAETELGVDDLAPRSILLMVTTAGRKLTRYRLDTEVKKQVGIWMLQTLGHQIISDHVTLLYGRGSLQFIITEDVDSRDVEITREDECVYLVDTRRDAKHMLHESQINAVVQNPQLRARLGLSDDEDTSEWEDPDGTGINL